MSVESSTDKELLILDAARKRFAYFGYSKSTMDEIASDVGMAKPSLYYYYATKDQLFNAVLSREQEEFVNDIDALLRQEIPWSTKLREYVAMRLRLFRELVNLSQLGNSFWTEIKSFTSDLYKDLERRELSFLQTIMTGGIASGEFVIDDPEQAAQLILHVVHGLRLRALRASRGPTIDGLSYDTLRAEMDLLIDYLLAGIQIHP